MAMTADTLELLHPNAAGTSGLPIACDAVRPRRSAISLQATVDQRASRRRHRHAIPLRRHHKKRWAGVFARPIALAWSMTLETISISFPG
ncbi:hypothetical protein [Xanthomonas arboricola]|uniref:hypothetical protein n=1 Tax=Xanthomonas arboricola TaxID=56448 RepID=UPI0012DB5083|nr:hypothetical protein [Xanthomonas arboricola]